jgi:hypothetical protein
MNDMPDQDGSDDGLLLPLTLPHCQRTVISYTVTVAPGAPLVTRTVNAWFDWLRDGDWDDLPECPDGTLAPEHAVRNQPVLLPAGTWVLQTPYFVPYNPDPEEPLWMRISIAEGRAPTVPGSNMADGRGPPHGYRYGETEDYYFEPEPDPDYDIYIKDSAADDGSVPSSSPWWESPDIWVRNDGDCTQTDHENPTAGSSTTVCVRVRNRMTTTVHNTNVDVYWANAALSLTWPGSWNGIGSFNIPSLAGGAIEVKSVSWNVPFFAGHICFLARADALEDPLATGPDTIAPVDHVPNNNNIAQKNGNIVDYPEVEDCGFYTTTVYTEVVLFDAVNSTNAAIQADIIFDSDDFPLGTGTFIVDPGDLLGDWNTLTNFSQSGNMLIPTAFPASMNDVQMGPNEIARMGMTLAARIDVRFTVDVEEQVNGTSVGGIQYVRDLPNCVYLPIIMKAYAP